MVNFRASRFCDSKRGTDHTAEPLLSSPAPEATTTPSPQQLALRDLLSSPTLRGPTILCATILALQQLSGVNAVMFYSTPVLKPLLPASAALIGLGITGVNALMTLPAMFLVDVGCFYSYLRCEPAC